MLDLGADTGFDRFHLIAQAVKFTVQVQRPTFAWSHRDIPDHLAFGFRPLGRALIACITEGFLLVAMQQRLRLRDIIDVAAVPITVCTSPDAASTPMCAFTEVPLITFLGLMHFRIALAFTVLGRGRCGDDRGCRR